MYKENKIETQFESIDENYVISDRLTYSQKVRLFITQQQAIIHEIKFVSRTKKKYSFVFVIQQFLFVSLPSISEWMGGNKSRLCSQDRN